MKHAARKAGKSANRRLGVSAKLFSAHHGSHTTAARLAQIDQEDVSAAVAVLGVDRAIAAKINEIAPQTRKSMRMASRAAQRRSSLIASTSLAALVGTAATAMAFANPNQQSASFAEDSTVTTTQVKRIDASEVSRSEARSSLTDTQQTSNSGDWQLGETNATLDVNKMSRSDVSNPKVAALVEQDRDLLPSGFDPNHATGDNGNTYPFSQCTWWVYTRRHQLGLPVGSHMGNGNMWANSARARGFWVDNTARHAGDIMVFAAGQDGSDAQYGHVAIVEKVNDDGSVVTSESGAAYNGGTFSRTFTAEQVSQHEIIHY